MKKIIFTLGTLFMSASSFAYPCRVDLIDNYGRLVQSYYAQNDYNGVCREGLRDCNRDMHMRGIPGQCVASTGPTPGPNPYPNPTPAGRYDRMNNYELAEAAEMRQVGRCVVARGGYNTSCQAYVKVNGMGYPYGSSGCADSQYTYQYGCNEYNSYENAGCMVRVALQQGLCF